LAARLRDEVKRIYAVDHGSKPPFGTGAFGFFEPSLVNHGVCCLTKKIGDFAEVWGALSFFLSGVPEIKYEKKSRCWTKNFFCIFVNVTVLLQLDFCLLLTPGEVKTWLLDCQNGSSLLHYCWRYHSPLWNPP